jgi:putative membrane protein
LKILAVVLVALVAFLHVWFLVLEMFLWNRPFGRKRFRMSPEKAEMTAPLAANQGLYNGFLAAGLVWGLIAQDPAQARAIQTFFLSCVGVAGLYGGLTTLRPILYIQALPAALALGAVWLASGG